jgi:hypothetical protein
VLQISENRSGICRNPAASFKISMVTFFAAVGDSSLMKSAIALKIL